MIHTTTPQDSVHLESYDVLLENFFPTADSAGLVNKQECLAQVGGIKITVDFKDKPPNRTATRIDLYVDKVRLIPRQ